MTGRSWGRVFDLVVVDDNRRFPFHLWHFLSSYTGLGSETSPVERRMAREPSSRPDTVSGAGQACAS